MLASKSQSARRRYDFSSYQKKLPIHGWISDLDSYFNEGTETGSFLRALLENDLTNAVRCMNPPDMSCLNLLLDALLEVAPVEGWGTPEKVANWLEDWRGLRDTDTALPANAGEAFPPGCERPLLYALSINQVSYNEWKGRQPDNLQRRVRWVYDPAQLSNLNGWDVTFFLLHGYRDSVIWHSPQFDYLRTSGAIVSIDPEVAKRELREEPSEEEDAPSAENKPAPRSLWRRTALLKK